MNLQLFLINAHLKWLTMTPHVPYIHLRMLSLLQSNRMKEIGDELELLFTELELLFTELGIDATLSTSQNSASVRFAFNSLTAATNQPAIIQSSPTQPITPKITSVITPAVTNQMSVLPSPAPANASTSGNVVSKSANTSL